MAKKPRPAGGTTGQDSRAGHSPAASYRTKLSLTLHRSRSYVCTRSCLPTTATSRKPPSCPSEGESLHRLWSPQTTNRGQRWKEASSHEKTRRKLYYWAKGAHPSRLLAVGFQVDGGVLEKAGLWRQDRAPRWALGDSGGPAELQGRETITLCDPVGTGTRPSTPVQAHSTHTMESEPPRKGGAPADTASVRVHQLGGMLP